MKFFIAVLLAILSPVVALALALVDINTAPLDQIENLPGIGKKTAEAIVAARPFKSVDDLKNVKGIGEGKLAKLKSLVSVGGSTPTAATTAATAATTATNTATTAAAATTTAATSATEAFGKTAKAAAAKATDLKPGEIVNINSAPIEQLEKLPGIGPVKAKAIMAARPFNAVEDLMKVKGIKEATLAKIKPFISVR